MNQLHACAFSAMQFYNSDIGQLYFSDALQNIKSDALTMSH